MRNTIKLILFVAILGFFAVVAGGVFQCAMAPAQDPQPLTAQILTRARPVSTVLVTPAGRHDPIAFTEPVTKGDTITAFEPSMHTWLVVRTRYTVYEDHTARLIDVEELCTAR